MKDKYYNIRRDNNYNTWRENFRIIQFITWRDKYYNTWRENDKHTWRLYN